MFLANRRCAAPPGPGLAFTLPHGYHGRRGAMADGVRKQSTAARATDDNTLRASAQSGSRAHATGVRADGLTSSRLGPRQISRPPCKAPRFRRVAMCRADRSKDTMSAPRVGDVTGCLRSSAATEATVRSRRVSAEKGLARGDIGRGALNAVGNLWFGANTLASDAGEELKAACKPRQRKISRFKHPG